VTIAPSAARNVATGAPVYAPGVIEAESVSERGEGDDGNDGGDTDPPLVACHTPDGAAVCLGRLVGDPDAESGVAVSLERVLV
jgi:tRNA pseudouridine55 synthase